MDWNHIKKYNIVEIIIENLIVASFRINIRQEYRVTDEAKSRNWFFLNQDYGETRYKKKIVRMQYFSCVERRLVR